jgi:hypothetical protein
MVILVLAAPSFGWSTEVQQVSTTQSTVTIQNPTINNTQVDTCFKDANGGNICSDVYTPHVVALSICNVAGYPKFTNVQWSTKGGAAQSRVQFQFTVGGVRQLSVQGTGSVDSVTCSR